MPRGRSTPWTCRRSARQAPAGNQFSVRLYGWRAAENPPGLGRPVWIPYLICELACTTCNRQGPPNTAPPGNPSNYMLGPDESLCDTISLTQGSLGLTGLINSTGPGTDLIAYAIVELTAPRYFQFDFGAIDSIPMNCLFAKGP